MQEASSTAAAAPVRVLVVEATAGRRRLIRMALAGNPRVLVAAMAADCAAASAALPHARPDVIAAGASTQGLADLAQIARSVVGRAPPLVLIGGDWPDERRAEASSAGHGDGAGPIPLAELGSAILAAAIAAQPPPHPAAGEGAGPRRPLRIGSGAPPLLAGDRAQGSPGFQWNGRHILIGASTGGVDALQRVLSDFPADCPPTIVVQHMPGSFLASFAQRLDQSVAPSIRLAEDRLPLRRGEVLLAPGGSLHLGLSAHAGLRCQMLAGDKLNGHRPSVDVTFRSALPVAAGTVAALLTGMGRDGAEGMRLLRAAGARTLAQDEASSVVWGMPRMAWENGGAEELVPLDRIGGRLIALCTRGPCSSPGDA